MKQEELQTENEQLKQKITELEQRNIGLEKQIDEDCPYLDKNHKYFSPALEAAVRAWTRLYVFDGYKEDSEDSRKKQLSDWVKKNRQDENFPQTTLNYITTVANPREGKSPGRRKKQD